MGRNTVYIASIAIAVLTLAGCAEPRPLPTPTPTPTETVVPTGDGVMRIGGLVPLAGDINGTGAALVAAIEVAAADINAAGGVAGSPVETFYRDAGPVDGDQLEQSFAELVQRGVDVVVAPPSPAHVARLLPLADAAGVALLASSAPAPTVAVAQPSGVLVRTIAAADRQVATIIAALAEEAIASVSLIAATDAQGQAVVDLARAATTENALELVTVERADANSTASRVAFSVMASSPDVVVLAVDGLSAEKAAELIGALLARGATAEQLRFTSSTSFDYAGLVPAGALEGASGFREGAPVSEALTARLLQSDPRLLSLRFAAETYDAVIVAALAAQVGGDDGGPTIARTAAAVLTGEYVCRSIGECLDALQNGQTIDYDGTSGSLTIDEHGDVVEAVLTVLRYDAESRPVAIGQAG